MKIIFSIVCLLILFRAVNAQNCETRSITILNQTLSETSGMLYLNGAFITFNDSGGEAELYEVDTADGSIHRTVAIQNATNVDWEAITADNDYIYVGDIGNNNGTRTNLKVYKMSISDFESSNSIMAEVINFNYSNQTTFVSESNATRFDAEALAIVDDALLLFSKNWQENTCLYYEVPKLAGNYSISPIDSLQTPGKVTDVVFLPAKNQLYMVGYAIEPFVLTLKSIVGTSLSNAEKYSCTMNVANSIQVEGICAIGNRVFYSSEYFSFGSLDLEGDFGEITYAASLGVIENLSKDITVKNDVNDFYFETTNVKIKQVEVFDTLGKVKISKKTNVKSFTLSKSQFERGCYIVKISLSNNKVDRIKVIIE